MYLHLRWSIVISAIASGCVGHAQHMCRQWGDNDDGSDAAHGSCPDEDARHRTLGRGAIAGIAVGSVAFLSLLILLAWFCIRRQRKKRNMAYQRSHSIDEEGARVGNTGPDAFVPQLANEYVAADVGHGHNTSPHSSRVNYSSHTLPTSPGLVYDPTRQSTISSGGSRLSYVTFNTPAQAGTSITSPMRSHSSRFPRLSTTHEFCDTIDSSSSLHSPSSDHGEEGFWLSRGRSQTSRHSSTRQSSALHEDMIQHQKQLEYEHQRDLEQLQEDEPAPAQYVSSQDPPPIYKELGGT